MSFDCQESYDGQVSVEGLAPYTYYILQGAVSSQYSRYSALSLGKGTNLRTRPGGEADFALLSLH